MTPEPQNLRRRNYHNMCNRLHKQFLEWRDSKPRYVMPVPNSTQSTPRMGDLDYTSALRWARRVTQADAEQSINMSNEQNAVARSKRRAGEAQ